MLHLNFSVTFCKFLLVFVWWSSSGFGEVLGKQIAKTAFSCDGRTSGYYADVAAGCQVYHMCDGLGRQFSYKCPSKTLFQQRMLICDHWYMVNCSKSEEDYSANLLIGQQGRHFVEDLQFRRTPRPDLVDPVNSEAAYQQMIRNTKTHAQNIVGAEEDQTSTEDSNYFPPSHWSTEIARRPTTPVPNNKRHEAGSAVQTGLGEQVFYNANHQSRAHDQTRQQAADPRFGFVKQVFYKTTYNSRTKSLQVDNKRTNVNSPNGLDNSLKTNSKADFGRKLHPGINHQPSSFTVTVPKPPDHVDVASGGSSGPESSEDAARADEAHVVNFPSKFQATTPVYPQHVRLNPSKLSEFDIPVEERMITDKVNFASNFKATTPVYPQHVDVDPSRLSEFDVPVDINPLILAVNFASKFKATTPVYPSFVRKELQTKFSGSEEDELPEGGEHVVNFQSDFKATTPVYPSFVDPKLQKKFSFSEDLPDAGEREEEIVKFPSNFKATTPVYPKFVDKKLQTKFNFDQDATDGREEDEPPRVNFASNFTATTPVYPKFVDRQLQTKFTFEEDLPVDEGNKTGTFQSNFEATTPIHPKHFPGSLELPGSNPALDFNRHVPSPFQVTTPEYPSSGTEEPGLPPPLSNGHVNFASSFQATTPDYPRSVEPTSPDPDDAGLAAPQSEEPPSFDVFQRRIDTDAQGRSVLGNTFSSRQLNDFMATLKPEQLKNLRDLWHIPEYQFPLEAANGGPSYEATFTSFQATPTSGKRDPVSSA